MTDRALSDAIAAGWVLVTYSAAGPYGDNVNHCFLLRRDAEYKIMVVKQKMFGSGYSVTEVEV